MTQLRLFGVLSLLPYSIAGASFADDIAVIGVHAPSTLEIVERYCDRIGLPFPVMIDTPQGNSGEFWSACRVHGIPHVMVVRPDGTIAGSGFYIDMLNLAKGMMRPRE